MVVRIQAAIVSIDGLVGYKQLFGIVQPDGHSVALLKKIQVNLAPSIHNNSEREHALKAKRHVTVAKCHTFMAKCKMEVLAADLELLG